MIEYVTPSTIDEALAVLAAHPNQARILAGGTDLLVDLRDGKMQAQVLVDITRIPALNQIQVGGRSVEVGAAVTFATVKNYEYFQNHVPMLAEAAGSVGAPGIQNSATWVGNLLQAMPAADGAIVALALEAEVRVIEPAGADWRPVTTIFAGPGRSAIDSSWQLITHLRFPIPPAGWGTAWQRIGRRSALTLPIINCAVKLELDRDRIQHAAVALGPVASTPFRARAAESFLEGKPPTEEMFEQAGQIAQGESMPRSNPLRASREYRLAIIPVVVRRALRIAAGRARGWKSQ